MSTQLRSFRFRHWYCFLVLIVVLRRSSFTGEHFGNYKCRPHTHTHIHIKEEEKWNSFNVFPFAVHWTNTNSYLPKNIALMVFRAFTWTWNQNIWNIFNTFQTNRHSIFGYNNKKNAFQKCECKMKRWDIKKNHTNQDESL